MPNQRFSLRDFDFHLPPELIAQHPCAQRSASRLLDGRSSPPVDRIFQCIDRKRHRIGQPPRKRNDIRRIKHFQNIADERRRSIEDSV